MMGNIKVKIVLHAAKSLINDLGEYKKTSLKSDTKVKILKLLNAIENCKRSYK